MQQISLYAISHDTSVMEAYSKMETKSINTKTKTKKQQKKSKKLNKTKSNKIKHTKYSMLSASSYGHIARELEGDSRRLQLEPRGRINRGVQQSQITRQVLETRLHNADGLSRLARYHTFSFLFDIFFR